MLQELQVETFGSMDKREKTQFILEQVSLPVALKLLLLLLLHTRRQFILFTIFHFFCFVFCFCFQMRLSLRRKDFTRTSILSKKISESIFEPEAQHDLKLLYHQYLIEVARHHNDYLALCKHCRAIFATPRVQAEPTHALASLRDAVL